MLPYRLKKITRKTANLFHIYKKDLVNIMVYGINAPKHLETIWINPQKVDSYIPKNEILRVTGKSRKEASGQVVDWSDVNKILPLENDFRYRYAFQRWRDGESWKEIGVFEYMKTKTIKYKNMSQNQLEDRYKRFDELFQDLKSSGEVKKRSEVDPSSFREENGILIHIGANGKLYFGGIGFHRFSIAKVLNLNQIPACIGIVDQNSIKHLKQIRKKVLQP